MAITEMERLEAMLALLGGEPFVNGGQWAIGARHADFSESGASYVARKITSARDSAQHKAESENWVCIGTAIDSVFARHKEVA